MNFSYKGFKFITKEIKTKTYKERKPKTLYTSE